MLKSYNRVLDISADDLADLFRRTEMHAYRRRIADTRCHQAMSRDVVSVEFGTELEEAWQLMRQHGLQALPVINRARRVIGIVTRADFLRHADLLGEPEVSTRVRRFLARTARTHSTKHEVIGQIMSSPARTASEATPLIELIPLMADVGHHHVPVVDAEHRLSGMITQTDLVGALYESSLAQADLPRAVAA